MVLIFLQHANIEDLKKHENKVEKVSILLCNNENLFIVSFLIQMNDF